MHASRRAPRYLVELPILLRLGRRLVSAVTEDVTFHGIFVRTDTVPPLRHLVQVELVLPPVNQIFTANAMPLHAVWRGSAGREPGVGLALYGLGRDAQEKWDRFIDWARTNVPEAGERATLLVRGERVEPVRARSVDHAAVLRVEVGSLEDLLLMHFRDLSQGGMFLVTDERFSVGDALGLQVIHPHSGDVFELSCVVRRVAHDTSVRGLGVELTDVDEERKQRFYEFIYDAIYELFDEESVRDEGAGERG
jgi:Tfp pilus assembly protein PilZ